MPSSKVLPRLKVCLVLKDNSSYLDKISVEAYNDPNSIPVHLAAFKESLRATNYLMGVCACCAREKRQCKLEVVEFPPATALDPPSWLPWSAAGWYDNAQLWYDQLHGAPRHG